MQALKSIKNANTITLGDKFKPHSGQQEIAAAVDKGYKRIVVRAGRRFGKSALALNLVLKEALYNPGRYWIIAPEYKQAKSIYWRDLVDEFIPKGLILRKNDSELLLEIMSLKEGQKSVIEFKGSDNENTLRGAGLRGVVLDEYAFQKEYVWHKIIGPMLVQTDGWALFITTPNGVANHFKPFWDDALEAQSLQDSPKSWQNYQTQLAQAHPDLEPSKEGYQKWQRMWTTFHFTSYDNPLIPVENIDAERARLTEEFFTQEYLAEFAKFTGLIYTGFDENIHIQNFEVDESWSFYRAIDFGATDPDAVPFIGVDKEGVIHIFDEIYVNELYTDQLAELIKQKSAHRYFVATYADSAGKQVIMDLTRYGIYSVPVQKNTGENSRDWLLATIRQVHQLLKDQKIIIHPRCKGMIKEFMSYSWRKDRMGEPVNLPEDKNNHLLDALRYFVVSYKGNDEQFVSNYLPPRAADPITGY